MWPTAGRLGTLRSQKWKNPSDLPADPEPGLNPRAHRSWRDSDKEHGVVPCSWRPEKCRVRLPGSLPPADPQHDHQGKSKNTGVRSLSLLQRIFLTQESNRALLNCRWILYQLSHERSPRILEWVAYPFSRGSSRPRTWIGLSCFAGRFLANKLSGKLAQFEF